MRGRYPGILTPSLQVSAAVAPVFSSFFFFLSFFALRALLLQNQPVIRDFGDVSFVARFKKGHGMRFPVALPDSRVCRSGLDDYLALGCP